MSYTTYQFTTGGVAHPVDGYVYVPDSSTFPKNTSYSPRNAITACSLVINGSSGGAEVNDLLPEGASNTIGTSARPFNAVHASMFYGNLTATTVSASGQISAGSFNATSSRKAKRNIKDSEIDALKLLNDVRIVDFLYKADHSKTPRIGFIAEDTDSLLSGRKHNSMDIGNCIGLLIKGLQELAKQIEKLRGS